MQPPPGTVLKKTTVGRYTYCVTAADLQMEQEAFEAGEGVQNSKLMYSITTLYYSFQKRELVKGFGVYIKYIDLEHAEQAGKNTPTGLMRALLSTWYTSQRLASCSATSGLNVNIRTAIFSEHLTCLK